jgi:hypothetical protein
VGAGSVVGGSVVLGTELVVPPWSVVDEVLPGRVVVGSGLGTISPVTVSTVVLGGSLMMTSIPERLTTRARTGSGRTTSPCGPNDTAVAGWLGGISTGRPSLSVGDVAPFAIGAVSCSWRSPLRLSQPRPMTSTTTDAAMSVAPTAGGGFGLLSDVPSPSPMTAMMQRRTIARQRLVLAATLPLPRRRHPAGESMRRR